MSMVLMDSSRFQLENVDNYMEKITPQHLESIYTRYTSILSEFINLAEKNKFKPNKGFQLYVIVKGIESLHHIFRFLLLYTCNIDLVYYHSHKAYYYYIEFIDQISKDDH